MGDFSTVVADEHGTLRAEPSLAPAAATLGALGPARDFGHFVPLPPGSALYRLPGRMALGFARGARRPSLAGAAGSLAVAAALPPGWLRLALPAYRRRPGAPDLPLRAYTAVAVRGGELYVLARRIDPRTHWEPERFAGVDFAARWARLRRRLPGNRILRQLGRCACEYGCSTARNFFLGTFEAGLPVSPRCNARCLGCISQGLSSAAGVCPQERIRRPPPARHIVEAAVLHLRRARPAMVSFGQGCEGEPLLEARRLQAAIAAIRRRTPLGTIHMNTNGSLPSRLPALARAGLDSVRVSLFSARPDAYAAYHGGSLTLARVEQFLARAVELGLIVSINLLVFPGFTDRQGELRALAGLLRRTGARNLQLRNLDLDPDRLPGRVPPAGGRRLGLEGWLKALRSEIDGLWFGSFNRFREELSGQFLDPGRPRR